MRFEHEGALVTHPRLHRAFLRGVRFLEGEGVHVVQLGHFRGQIEVEDVAWWVVLYDGDSGEIELTDGSRERLTAASLRVEADESICCVVKETHRARFTHAGQALLLDALEERGDELRLRAGADWLKVSGLSAVC